MSTSDERIAQLVKRGVMPSRAARVVAEVDARGGRLLNETERAADAQLQQTPESIAEAEAEGRVFWYYSPDISRGFRRILDARVVGDGKST